MKISRGGTGYAMSIKERDRINFVAGLGAAWGAHLFFQDALGLEGYISFLRDHWWPTHWSLWIFCILLTLALRDYLCRDTPSRRAPR